ncbi:MAG: hypothetical protein Kow0077_22030 [Anaerolineae bacterium]
MSDQPPAPAADSAEENEQGYDIALAYAWHRFNSYDSQSGQLKRRYARIRWYIIVASLMTTILSVLSVVETSERYWRLGLVVLGLLAFILGLRMATSYRNLDWTTAQTRKRFAAMRDALQREPNRALAEQPETKQAPAEPTPLQNFWQRFESGLRITVTWVLVVGYVAAGAILWLFSNGAADIAALTAVDSAVFLPAARILLTMLLIALPLVSSGLLDFAARFESRRNWVGFRLGAERIRRAIYILRVRNYYEELTPETVQALNDIVKKARTELIELGVTAPLLSDDFDPEKGRVKPNWTYVPEDDGYSLMSVDDYFRQRLTPQLNWYRDRIRRDYSRTRYFRGYILLFGGMGALLTALNLSEFAAITTAIVTAIVTWLALMAHEQNYRVYASTLARLEEEAADYKVRQDSATTAERIQFVRNVEKVLADELENWSRGVLQAQDVIEDNLGKMTKQDLGEEKFEPGERPETDTTRLLDVRGEPPKPSPAETALTALPEDPGPGNGAATEPELEAEG